MMSYASLLILKCMPFNINTAVTFKGLCLWGGQKLHFCVLLAHVHLYVALFWNFESVILTIFQLYYRWHAVASWTWDAQDETCGICRMAFDGCCPDCKLPGDDCPLSKLETLFSYFLNSFWIFKKHFTFNTLDSFGLPELCIGFCFN